MRAAQPRSGSVRERLLRVGARQARRAGLRALTVRGACAQAGVNLGSFVYHFGSRDAFVAQVIERWYAPLLERLTATVDEAQPPERRLRALLLQLGDWAATNSRLITHVLMDAAAGEAAAQRFIATLADRHPALILGVIREGQRSGALPRGEPLNVMLFLMGAIALPILLTDRLAEVRLAPARLTRALMAFSRERRHRERRLDWALAGLLRETRHAH
ncbi:MAG TPA: TetR/AcrR family transcriptional regulator [Burkholderiaceae bacterium]|nr:TetR/AcrR family transcriptional regulator [Burkholderiaceae bacterium]